MKDTVSRIRWYIPFNTATKFPGKHTTKQLSPAPRPSWLLHNQCRSITHIVDPPGGSSSFLVCYTRVCDTPCAAEWVWRLTIARMISGAHKMPLCKFPPAWRTPCGSCEMYSHVYNTLSEKPLLLYVLWYIYIYIYIYMEIYSYDICINLINICTIPIMISRFSSGRKCHWLSRYIC